MVGSIQWWQQREPAFRHAGMDIYLASATQGRGIGTEAVRLLARAPDRRRTTSTAS